MTVIPNKLKVVGTITRDEIALAEPIVLHNQPVVYRTDEGFQQLDNIQYTPIGRCIYCGSTADLTREHIIPYGLSGTAVLPEASCKACAQITSKVELQVLRGSMRPARMVRRLRSRKQYAGVTETQRLTVICNGVEKKVDLPLEQYPILLTLPIFPVPQYLSGAQASGIKVSGIHSILFGPTPADVLMKLGGQEIRITTASDHPHAFPRMLAKIAYASSIALGFDKILEGSSFVLPAILGIKDDIGQWVGTVNGPNTKYPCLHRVAMRFERGLLIAEVQLFSDSETPSYCVVLGELSSAVAA